MQKFAALLRRASRQTRREDGQAVLEFALVFPLFVLLIFATIELGWVGYQHVSFDYACSHANWGYVKDEYKDAGDYADQAPTELSSGVDTVFKKAVTDSSWFGMDASKIAVTDAHVILTSTSSTFNVPNYDKKAQDATQYTRHMHAHATISYQVKPLVGFFVTEHAMERTVDYDQIIGQQRRSY
ncbi:TadE/TadG family type IV pilus assembly protein [Atopobium fossor]|uniref:TadE/TadG family type IV pilus assembly protein n=1 Tax=Atopobium fossor TaxID=39487 RepID=UPI0004263914|nr:TadE family protein [Atopobium fossor]